MVRRARAAVLALFASCITFDYFFLQPFYTLYITSADIPYFVVFTLFASLVTWFSTIRRRVEADLRQARDKLEIEVMERTQQASLLNLTHDTIFVRDMNEVITYWNRGAQELYGWTPEEAIGKRAHELLQTSFRRRLPKFARSCCVPAAGTARLEKTRSDGTRVIVASRWSLRRDEQGRPAAILETNNDITDRKRREEQIRALNEELAKTKQRAGNHQ